MRIVDAVVDDQGAVRLLEPLRLPAGQRLLVTVLEEPAAARDVARLEGCISYEGRPISIEEMNQAVIEGSTAG